MFDHLAVFESLLPPNACICFYSTGILLSNAHSVLHVHIDKARSDYQDDKNGSYISLIETDSDISY